MRRAAQLGLRRAELSGPLWRPVRRGVRLWHGLDPTEPDVRAVVAAAEPHGYVAVGGWAALFRAGVTCLDGRTGAGAERLLPLLLHVGPSGRSRRTPLLDVDRGAVPPCHVVELAGLRVTSPAFSCVAIARRYGLEEGLVAADAAVAARLTTPADLRRLASGPRGARGIRAARLMAELVDGRSASPQESRLRYVWIVEAGLPQPQVNVTVVDAGGGFVARPDLLDPEAAAVAEYDGAQHRALAQHTADNAREEALERLGLVVARATAYDLFRDRAGLVRRLHAAHRSGQALDTGPRRWDWRLS